MDDLVKYVADKTGLSLDQARQAAQATIDYLKSQMPAPQASEVDMAAPDDEGLPGPVKDMLALLDKL